MSRRTLTPKQERFCLLIVKGETNSKAYDLAGYQTSSRRVTEVNASKLLRSPSIQAKIAELQRYAAQKALINLESLTEDLLRLRERSVELEQMSAAISAHALLARLHGLLVDHKTVDVVHHKPAPLPTKQLELTEDEWRRQFDKKQLSDKYPPKNPHKK